MKRLRWEGVFGRRIFGRMIEIIVVVDDVIVVGEQAGSRRC